jgi:hypothetical protein
MGRLKSDVESAREIELRLKDTFQMKDAETGMEAPHLKEQQVVTITLRREQPVFGYIVSVTYLCGRA